MSAYEQEQSKSQQSLESANQESSSQAAMSVAESEPEAAESVYSREAFLSALQSKDAAGISSQLNGLSLDSAKEIASDSQLMGLIENLDKAVRDSVYDKIYIGISDVDQLCKIAFKRLGVAFGTKYSDDEEAKKNAESLLKTVVTDNRYASYRAKGGDTMETIEKAWPIEGAQHLYAVFSRCPEAHLKKLKIVMASDIDSGGGAGGLAYSSLGVYLMCYSNNSIDSILDTSHMFHSKHDEKGNMTVGGVRISSDKDDANYGLNRFDQVAAHEFGHVVDYGHSPAHSSTDEFRALTGWKEYKNTCSVDGAKEVVKDLRSYMSTPVPAELASNEDANALIDMVAEELIMEDLTGTSKLDAKVEDFLNGDMPVVTTDGGVEASESIEDMEKRYKQLEEEWKKGGYDSKFYSANLYPLKQKIDHDKRRLETNPAVDRYMNMYAPDIDAFAKSLKSAPMLQHIVRVTSGTDPWFYHEPFNGFANRQIHSDYHVGTWYSYDMKARSNKISNYQFSDPAEEFAELYASYMAADETTRKTPEAHKKWFEENVLTEKPPQEVLDAAGVTPETDTATDTDSQKDNGKDKDKKKKKKWWQFWK